MYRKMTALILILLLHTGFAQATNWCGENGVVRLSFTPGPEPQAVLHTEETQKGVTMVDLYALMTDITPVHKNGEAFLGLGSLEMRLLIEGAEGFITSQEFPVISRSVGRKPGEIMSGFYPGIEFEDGATQLVHWKIMFQGTPENVVFRLDTTDGVTAERTEGMAGLGCSALYTGMDQQGQLGDIFGAAGAPAYLNPSAEPDLQVQHSKVSWQQAGQYEAR